MEADDDLDALKRYQAHPNHVPAAQRSKAASQSTIAVDFDPTAPTEETTMSKYENIVQGAAEKLLEDERLRANLTDDEVNILVNWAIGWLDERVSAAPDDASARQIARTEMARLRPSMQEISAMLREGTSPSFNSFGLSSSEEGTSSSRQDLIRDRIRRLSDEWSQS
jgi:hypothetical protein